MLASLTSATRTPPPHRKTTVLRSSSWTSQNFSQLEQRARSTLRPRRGKPSASRRKFTPSLTYKWFGLQRGNVRINNSILSNVGQQKQLMCLTRTVRAALLCTLWQPANEKTSTKISSSQNSPPGYFGGANGGGNEGAVVVGGGISAIQLLQKNIRCFQRSENSYRARVHG